MPYSLRGNQPGCDGWAVVNTATGRTVKCHPTKKAATAHLRALYKNVGDTTMQDLALNVSYPDAPGGMMQIGASGPEDTDQQLDDIAAAANPDKNRSNAEVLRRHWTTGPGAAKIRWGQPGDFDRCTREMVDDAKMTPEQAAGYCNLLHHRALGYYPATHKKMEHGGKHAAAAEAPHLPALVTIPGVDILAAGTWQLSTGRQTFTRADLEAAIEAAACPAVGSPLIKIGHLDPRFASAPDHDGEPAIGKVTNMRLAAGGTKITGDLAGMPGWLAGIAASAFPRRSVEGKYGFRCQIGHDHPFVVTALALLGVTPPGVGVLSGLDDIAALYGVHAAGHWKHEWIPLDLEAAKEKFQGRVPKGWHPPAREGGPHVPDLSHNLPQAPSDPGRYTGSDWNLKGMTSYLEAGKTREALHHANEAARLQKSGGSHQEIIQRLAAAETAAPNAEQRAFHAARLDAYANAHGLKGWYRYESTAGGKHHAVQVNKIRTPEEGDKGRYHFSSSVGSSDRGRIVDRDTGKFVTPEIDAKDAKAKIADLEKPGNPPTEGAGKRPTPRKAHAAAREWHTEPIEPEEGPVVAVTEEDVRRAYYAAGVPHTRWITELQMAPTQLIVADDADSKLYRVPFSIDAEAVRFGDAEEIDSYADVAAARGTGTIIAWASAEESRAVTAGTLPPWLKPGGGKTSSDTSGGGTSGGYQVKTGVKGCFGHAVVDSAGKIVAGGCHPDQASAEKHLATLTKNAAAADQGNISAANAADLDAAARRYCASQGWAMADGSYPIRPANMHGATDLTSAIRAVGRGGASHDTIRAHIIKRAAAIGLSDRIPGNWSKSGSNTAAAAEDENPGEDEQDPAAAAGDGHGSYTGEHAHPHTANGDQGGDLTHDHMHRHNGDGVHAHAHDPVSAAPPASTQEEGGSEEMEFTTEQLAAIRAKLGKNDGDEVTPAEIAAAFTDTPTVTASAGPVPKPNEELGVYLVEASVLNDWKKAAEAGERAVTELRHSQREEVLAAAIRDGKIPQSRLDHWRKSWEADEKYTRDQLEHLAKGFVPVGPAIGAAGLDPDLPGGFEEQMAYKKLYPEDVTGGRRG